VVKGSLDLKLDHAEKPGPIVFPSFSKTGNPIIRIGF
jgi:hypothetical protein